MFKKTILIGILTCVIAGPAFANSISREEGTGVGVGAVIGGVVGGPVGVILGAAVGGKLGDEFYQRNGEIDSLSTSLKGSKGQLVALQRNIEALNVEIRSLGGELQHARQMSRPEIVALLQAGIEMDLLFRTGESELTGSTGGKLSQLAASIAGNPEIRVRLDGFADERGDETYNQELSARRVEHVRDLLISQGIAESSISFNAHGESPASDESADSYALERRVSLTLYIGDTPSFASNPQ